VAVAVVEVAVVERFDSTFSILLLLNAAIDDNLSNLLVYQSKFYLQNIISAN